MLVSRGTRVGAALHHQRLTIDCEVHRLLQTDVAEWPGTTEEWPVVIHR